MEFITCFWLTFLYLLSTSLILFFSSLEIWTPKMLFEKIAPISETSWLMRLFYWSRFTRKVLSYRKKSSLLFSSLYLQLRSDFTSIVNNWGLKMLPTSTISSTDKESIPAKRTISFSCPKDCRRFLTALVRSVSPYLDWRGESQSSQSSHMMVEYFARLWLVKSHGFYSSCSYV